MNDAFVSLATKMLVDMAMHFFKSTSDQVYVQSSKEENTEKTNSTDRLFLQCTYALEMP